MSLWNEKEAKRDHACLTSTRKGGGRVLKFVMCLRILLFFNNRSMVHFCRWWGRGVKNWSFFVNVINGSPQRLFQILPFCNVLIEKPKMKGLKNINLLHDLPFYD